MKLHCRTWPGVLWLACSLMVTAAFAAKPAPETVAADKILAAWVKATGGEARLKRSTHVEFRGEIIFPGAPPFEVVSRIASERGLHTSVKLPPGEMVLASDRRTAWRHRPDLGFAVVPLSEAEEILRFDDPQWPLKVKKFFTKRRVLPDVELDGRKLQVIELVAATGRTERWYFDPKTNLRMRREAQEGAGVQEVTDYSDYRTTDGITRAMKTRMKRGPNTFEAVLKSVDWAAKFDEAIFRAPPQLLEEHAIGEKVLARLLAASGGAAALQRINSRVTRATVEMLGAGLKFETKMSLKAPNRIVSEQSIPGVGTVLQGFDGQTGWAWAELQGYRELSGPELLQLMNSADLHGMANLADRLPFRKWLGEREVDGRTMQVMELGMMQGPAGTHYFDRATGLLARVESVLHTGPGGVINVLLELDDYREVDGVVLPFRVTITNPAMKMVTTTQEIVHNVELDDRLFAPRRDGELPEG